ncbi:hypothetical protein [Candidatus Williamhamiltonella defendens]|uniref:hypothetical protein n=1 Tax=Candidatus Williamhamiltonella defendens TaxID=138072 RepID=UPI0002D8D080|nr:hypothetical protein [Candidatus Hamiltonella defensa]
MNIDVKKFNQKYTEVVLKYIYIFYFYDELPDIKHIEYGVFLAQRSDKEKIIFDE